ncbi:TolC family protein [Mangrovibacterium lignilyticum]|uniref:TolC family protein n=1 Tax=Mangrovibacterium lignilyticum TaxID=2668052 RepID=UPI0013D4A061|nr:TolC family protein [Mangrovibacterium lignilyticum]
MKYYAIIFFVLLAVASNAQGQLSLSDAIRISLENNYDLEIQRNDELIAKVQNTWGAAGRYPYIDLSAEARTNYNINENDNFLQNQYVGSATLGWTLFDGFSVKLNKQRLNELETLSGQNTGLMVESTIQSVILAYYSVLLQKEKLDVYEEVMQLSEDLYNKSAFQKEIGSAVTYDVLQAQNAYLEDKSSYLLQQVSYKSSLRDLQFLMATDSLVDYELTDDFEAIPIEYQLDELEEAMLANNKSLKNQYINQNLLKNAVSSAKSDFYPRLSFAGGATASRTGVDYETQGVNWSNMNNFYGNFTLSFNLFGGGAKKRAKQIAEIEQQSGDVSLVQMKHELNNQLNNVYEFYEVRKELLDVARENMETAKLNLQISREKYESGSINSFNFRDVQNLYLNVALGELEAIYQFVDIHTNLLRLTGGIIQQYSE